MSLTLPKQYDFLGRFFRLTIVNAISSIMVPLANAINVIFLGHLSDIQYLTGVALAGEVLTLLYSIFISLRMSSTALTAIAVGQDDREELLLVGIRHGLIALVLGIAIVVLQYPLGKLGFALIGTAPETLASATEYFNAQIWGAPATLLRFVLVGWFLGQEHSKKVLILSLVGSAANIALDYLLIVQWNWGSMGAGTSYMISQYLVLLIGLIFLCRDIKLSEIQAIIPKFWDSSAFRYAFKLNGNLFINSIVLLLVFLIFNYQSVGMGTIIYAGNSLILEIVTLSLYISDSLKLSLETIGGNFKGKGENEQLPHLVWTAVGISLLVGLITAGISVLFPEMVFGLFTNHSEVIDKIVIYIPWLILILVSSSVVYVMIGYFIVLAEGQTIRDSSLISALLGFAPAAMVVFWVHSNHVLWLALSLFFTVRIVILGIQLPRTLIAENSPDTGVA